MQHKWYQKPEMIIGLSALMVSLVAVVVSVYSAYIDRAYARASVWPRLTLSKSDYYKDGLPIYEYRIENAGTGPAVIKYAYVSADGTYFSRWSQVFEHFNLEVENVTQSHISSRVVPAGKSFAAQYTNNTEFMPLWRRIDSKIDIEICYCSIYNECWQVDRRTPPQEIAACTVDTTKAFRQ